MLYQKILLIDDDEDDQEIFLTALAMASAEVQCTAINNAREALHQLLQKQIAPDLIFLDLNMPIMNGQQFLVEIKKHDALKDIPVIVFSTSSHVNTIKISRDLGAFDFITKPDKFDDLVMILETLFR